MNKTDMLYKLPVTFPDDKLHSFISNFNFVPNGFGHQHNDVNACCGDRIIGDFELIYIIGGAGIITVDGVPYDVQMGDIVLIPPFVKHSIGTLKTNPYNNYWIHFDVYPYYKQRDFIQVMIPNKYNKITIGTCDKLYSIYRNLEEELNNRETGYKTFFATMLTQVITLILRHNSNAGYFPYLNDIDKASPERIIVDKSLNYIYDNISGSIRIEDIGNSLHISESYVYKAFEKVLKVSPNQFIQFVKMKKSENLIKTTDMTFKEISDSLGFSSPYYFSKVFKKYYGVSPREYAEKTIY